VLVPDVALPAMATGPDGMTAGGRVVGGVVDGAVGAVAVEGTALAVVVSAAATAGRPRPESPFWLSAAAMAPPASTNATTAASHRADADLNRASSWSKGRSTVVFRSPVRLRPSRV
jgi:hypothetical protein